MLDVKVSICIPVYNGQAYLSETIQSVINQTCNSLEIIIQDNCSTDATLSIVNEFKLKDSRIKLRENSRFVSMAANWNLATKDVSGDFILLLSADDLLNQDFIEECLNLFEVDKELDFVTANHLLLEKEKLRKRKIKVQPGKREVSCHEILLKNPFSINFTLFRKDFSESMRSSRGNLFREPFYTCDYDLWLRASQSAARLNFIEKPLGIYRVHQSSLSSNKLRMIKHTLLVLELNRMHLIDSGCLLNYKLVALRLLARKIIIFFRNGVFSKNIFKILIYRILF